MYRPGHRVWWRGLHVTMWGVLSGARGQGKGGWFRGERSRRFMELAFWDEHGRLSPGLSVIDLFGDWRSDSLISPQEARRRISRQAQLKLMRAQKCKFKCTTPVRRLLRQHRAWRACGLKGTACLPATGFLEWTFVGNKVSSARELSWRSVKEGAINKQAVSQRWCIVLHPILALSGSVLRHIAC